MDKVIRLEASGVDWWGEYWKGKKSHSVTVERATVDGFPNAPVLAFVHTYCPAATAAKLLRLMAEEVERRARLFGVEPETHKGGQQ